MVPPPRVSAPLAGALLEWKNVRAGSWPLASRNSTSPIGHNPSSLGWVVVVVAEQLRPCVCLCALCCCRPRGLFLPSTAPGCVLVVVDIFRSFLHVYNKLSHLFDSHFIFFFQTDLKPFRPVVQWNPFTLCCTGERRYWRKWDRSKNWLGFLI